MSMRITYVLTHFHYALKIKKGPNYDFKNIASEVQLRKQALQSDICLFYLLYLIPDNKSYYNSSDFSLHKEFMISLLL